MNERNVECKELRNADQDLGIVTETSLPILDCHITTILKINKRNLI